MTGIVITPLHAYYSEEHLETVIVDMKRLGSPRIRAYYDDVSGAWFAQEGTHRLRAALHLDVPPTMVPVPWTRSEKALDRARYAARSRGHTFRRILIKEST